LKPGNPVEVYQAIENGQPGIGIRVSGPANLQDLLDAWQPLCDDSSIYKTYAEGNHNLCKGCQINCCSTAYVIPDLICFKHMASLLKIDYADLLSRYFQSEKLAAGLLRMQPNPCVFLQDNICIIYPVRSLICRFYICTRLMGETEELIYKIAWSGAAATQVFAEENGLLPQSRPGISSFDRLFINLLQEYREQEGVNLFMQAREYTEVPLEPFLPKKRKG